MPPEDTARQVIRPGVVTGLHPPREDMDLRRLPEDTGQLLQRAVMVPLPADRALRLHPEDTAHHLQVVTGNRIFDLIAIKSEKELTIVPCTGMYLGAGDGAYPRKV